MLHGTKVITLSRELNLGFTCLTQVILVKSSVIKKAINSTYILTFGEKRSNKNSLGTKGDLQNGIEYFFIMSPYRLQILIKSCLASLIKLCGTHG